MKNLYEDKDPNKVKISFDEKAKIAIKEYFGSVYTKDKFVTYPSKQKVKGLLEMPAGMNIETGKIHYWFYDWKNSFIVIECLENLIKEYPGKEIYVILDNWSAHKSHDVKVWNDLHPRMHLVYLPSNASFLNKIERVFAFLSRDVLQNSNFQTVREAMERISNYFEKEGSIMV
ncbi:IS630 family transposase [Candidatus Pacearchaeota archaeon]|nr:IS630 family transposase [Candidatus Pacearchaeota archaeon]